MHKRKAKKKKRGRKCNFVCSLHVAHTAYYHLVTSSFISFTSRDRKYCAVINYFWKRAGKRKVEEGTDFELSYCSNIRFLCSDERSSDLWSRRRFASGQVTRKVRCIWLHKQCRKLYWKGDFVVPTLNRRVINPWSEPKRYHFLMEFHITSEEQGLQCWKQLIISGVRLWPVAVTVAPAADEVENGSPIVYFHFRL